jgi:hypothetical protein
MFVFLKQQRRIVMKGPVKERGRLPYSNHPLHPQTKRAAPSAPPFPDLKAV